MHAQSQYFAAQHRVVCSPVLHFNIQRSQYHKSKWKLTYGWCKHDLTCHPYMQKHFLATFMHIHIIVHEGLAFGDDRVYLHIFRSFDPNQCDSHQWLSFHRDNNSRQRAPWRAHKCTSGYTTFSRVLNSECFNLHTGWWISSDILCETVSLQHWVLLDISTLCIQISLASNWSFPCI